MGQWQFHTPEGVMDYLPDDCAVKRQLEHRIRQLFSSRGFDEVETPGFEFYDVYAGSAGFTPQETLFKFFDHKGRILCLRYDGTVPVARLAATICKDAPLPLRLSYLGNMYRFNESGGGRQREFTQAGVELLGRTGADADAEIIATAIESARALGLKDLQVSIGQVAFFKGLIAQWGLDEEQARRLPQLIDARETVALEQLVGELNLDERASAILDLVTGHDGSIETVDRLLEMVDSPACIDALINLKDVLAVLADYDLLPYISVDLGMLQSMNYYSGIIFKGFTYGLGYPLFSGGRYDQVVSAFGHDLAATGFSIGINFVMIALRRQDLEQPETEPIVRLLYEPEARPDALALAATWRAGGLRVICEARSDFVGDLVEMRQSGDATSFDADRVRAALLSKPDQPLFAWLQRPDEFVLCREGGDL